MLKTLISEVPMDRSRQKCAMVTLKFEIWGQKSIFGLVIAIFVDGANDHYTRGYNFLIGTTPKKISLSELGVIFWGSPLFLAVFGH